MYATKRHDIGERASRRYATDNKFQYLNYNLRCRKSIIAGVKEKTRMKLARNEIFAVHCLGGIAVFICAHRISPTRRGEKPNCMYIVRTSSGGWIGRKLSMRMRISMQIATSSVVSKTRQWTKGWRLYLSKSRGKHMKKFSGLEFHIQLTLSFTARHDEARRFLSLCLKFAFLRSALINSCHWNSI